MAFTNYSMNRVFQQTKKTQRKPKCMGKAVAFADKTRSGTLQPPWNLVWNLKLGHFWHIISDPFVKFVIIWNKWRHSFEAKCAYWHGNECFPPIIHEFNAECDPACEYLTALHASLICIHSHSMCICLFSSISPFLSIHHQISGISAWELSKY